MYCLDSSAIIEILCGTEEGKKISELTNNLPTFISSFSIYELLRGANSSDKEKINKFLSESEVLGFDTNSAKKSADLELELKKSGTPINNVDIFISGICLSKRLIIVTCDKDFLKVKGLVVKYFQKSNKVYKEINKNR